MNRLLPLLSLFFTIPTYSMINRYCQTQLITTKQAIIESENYLQSLFDKPFPEIEPSLAQLSCKTRRAIVDRSGDAKPILLLALQTPRDIQRETITWITDGDECSAHLFYTLPLGKALIEYKTAQTNAHRFPLRPLTLTGGLLPTGTYMRLDMQQCALLETLIENTSALITHNKTNTVLILTVEKDILERLGLKGKTFARDYLTPYEQGMTILRAPKTGYNALSNTVPLFKHTLRALTIILSAEYRDPKRLHLMDHVIYASCLTAMFLTNVYEGYGIEKQNALQQTIETL